MGRKEKEPNLNELKYKISTLRQMEHLCVSEIFLKVFADHGSVEIQKHIDAGDLLTVRNWLKSFEEDYLELLPVQELRVIAQKMGLSYVVSYSKSQLIGWIERTRNARAR